MIDSILGTIITIMILFFSTLSTIIYAMIMKRNSYPNNWNFLYVASTVVNLATMIVYIYIFFQPQINSFVAPPDIGRILGRPIVLLYSVLSASRAWIIYFGPKGGIH
jgi:magnesium-transporting ATPase (P-type)